MMKIRSARAGEGLLLAPRLRAADLLEIKAVTGEEPSVALERSIAWSRPCYSIVGGDDRSIALFGAVPNPHASDVGIIWLLASDELVRHPFFVMRSSRKWIEQLQQHYRILWNYVDARNAVHLRWLEWCGFDIIRMVDEYGVERRPFYEFTRVSAAASKTDGGEPAGEGHRQTKTYEQTYQHA